MLKILNRKIYALARGRKAIYIGFDKVEVEISKELLSELEEYLMRRRKEFSFEPDFSIYEGEVRRVLKYVYKNVKYGETKTYGDIAKSLNLNPRFVGYALSRNRHLILIPCHRIISRRNLGGFSAGLEVKKFLLSLEGFNILEGGDGTKKGA